MFCEFDVLFSLNDSMNMLNYT